MRRRRIALDFSSFDRLSLAYGLYRYPVDLVRGLAAVRPDADFTLIGSRPEPVPELADVFAETGGRWSYHHFPRRQGRFAYFRDQLPMRRAVRRMGIDLVHALDFFVPFAARCPLVVTVYDLMFQLFAPPGARGSLYIECFRRLVPWRISKVIAISETTARDLRERWRVPQDRIATVPLGTRFQTAASEVGATEGGPHLLARYSLTPHKNLPTLIHAVGLLRREFPDVRLTLFGRAEVGAEQEAALDGLIREHGLEGAVARPGFVSDSALAELYAGATLFVLPSLYEGFGLPLLEAMARGLCVVAHDGGAMAEVVGPAGCLVDARSPERIADGVAALLRDSSRRQALAAAGRERARSFTVERMAEETWRVYEKCLVAG